MTRVCLRFTKILHDELFWKKMLTNIIIFKHLEGNVTMIRNPFNAGLEDHWLSGRDVLWRDLAVNLSSIKKKWQFQKIGSQLFRQPHFAPVDTTKIIGNGSTIVSGGRDRMVNLWKINADSLHLEAIYSADRNHTGWIWDIDFYEPDTFFTCSWDHEVVLWATEGLQRLCSFNCGKPVMAISTTRGLVAAGLHSPKIILLDPRIGFAQAKNSLISFDMHGHTVTDVLLLPEQNLLLSTSEDKSLCFFDIRYHKQRYKTVTISRDNSFPRCIAHKRGLIYIGDSRGNIHMTSVGSDASENLVLNVGTTRLITSVVPHVSCVTVGSFDAHIRIISTCTTPPVLLWDQTINGQVTSVDQYKDLIAASSALGSVNLYKPINQL
ncbi:F-box/WD repeat-containing protein 9-like isoform X2 [Rhodnius prolixus]